MASVRAAQGFSASVYEAQECWYDTSRWPQWIDGLQSVLEVDPRWPEVGACVVWESGPAGRGRVRERVVEHEPLRGQSVEVEDDSIRGRQRVVFEPAEGGVEVQLSLEYELKERSLVTSMIDTLFIRRAMASSLRATLLRFGAELEGTRRRQVG